MAITDSSNSKGRGVEETQEARRRVLAEPITDINHANSSNSRDKGAEETQEAGRPVLAEPITESSNSRGRGVEETEEARRRVLAEPMADISHATSSNSRGGGAKDTQEAGQSASAERITDINRSSAGEGTQEAGQQVLPKAIADSSHRRGRGVEETQEAQRPVLAEPIADINHATSSNSRGRGAKDTQEADSQHPQSPQTSTAAVQEKERRKQDSKSSTKQTQQTAVQQEGEPEAAMSADSIMSSPPLTPGSRIRTATSFNASSGHSEQDGENLVRDLFGAKGPCIYVPRLQRDFRRHVRVEGSAFALWGSEFRGTGQKGHEACRPFKYASSSEAECASTSMPTTRECPELTEQQLEALEMLSSDEEFKSRVKTPAASACEKAKRKPDVAGAAEPSEVTKKKPKKEKCQEQTQPTEIQLQETQLEPDEEEVVEGHEATQREAMEANNTEVR